MIMKTLLLSLALALSPMLVHAVDVQVNISFGSVDTRGYYWDGYQYREPSYWKKHNGPRGAKYYTGRSNNGVPHQGGGHCPPGQAKKGNC